MPIASVPDDAVDRDASLENRSILSALQPEPTEQIAYGPNSDQVADVFLPSASTTKTCLVIFVHGGYWRPSVNLDHARSLARALADAGCLTCSIEYRRVPGEPNVMIGDVLLAIASLPGLLGFDGQAPLLVGHSAGGHLALVAASRLKEGIAGVLALAPVTDLHDAHARDLGSGAVAAFLGGPAGSRPDLDPVRCPEPASPVTVIHGARDSIVPIAQAHALALAWPNACRIVVVDDAAHFELIDPTAQGWEVVAAEVERQALRLTRTTHP